MFYSVFIVLKSKLLQFRILFINSEIEMRSELVLSSQGKQGK